MPDILNEKELEAHKHNLQTRCKSAFLILEALEDKADVLNASGNVATSMAVEMHDAATEAGEKIEDVLYEALMAVKGDRTSMQELMFVFNRIAREHVNRQYVDNGENKEED